MEQWQSFVDMIGKYDEWGATEWKTMAPFMSKEQQLRWADLVFAETRKYTNQELVTMSVEYSKHGRLAPIAPVVAPVVDPMETLKDLNWGDRGLFTPVDDPVFGLIILAQAQYKLTETPPRTKWACRPVGYDNGFVYLKYLGYGPEKLKKLTKTGVI